MNTLEHAAQQALEALERWRDWDDSNNTAAWGLDDEEAIANLREALKPNREGKYYYKDNACTASSADSPDCICWHDEASEQPCPNGCDTIIESLTKLLEIQTKSEEVAIKMIKAAVLVEREACAKVCEEIGQRDDIHPDHVAIECAAAIRNLIK